MPRASRQNRRVREKRLGEARRVEEDKRRDAERRLSWQRLSERFEFVFNGQASIRVFPIQGTAPKNFYRYYVVHQEQGQ